MRQDDFICPMPMKWNDIHKSLLSVWKKAGAKPDDRPPEPLILAAWWEYPLIAKKARWLETLDWADKHNCRHLIPDLAESDKFRG
jgi:hypothetical protein